MKGLSRSILLTAVLAILLSACVSSTPRAVQVVEEYLNLFTTKGTDHLSTITCADWTATAVMEMNSFQAVAVNLQDLSCEESGRDGDYILVTCLGKIVTSYDGEQREIDLSLRTYQVLEQGGDYFVCGYR